MPPWYIYHITFSTLLSICFIFSAFCKIFCAVFCDFLQIPVGQSAPDSPRSFPGKSIASSCLFRRCPFPVLHSFHQVINILCFDSSPHAEYSRFPTDRGGHPRSVGAAAPRPRQQTAGIRGRKKEDAYASSSAISASQFASVSTSGTKPSSRCVPHTSVGTMRISSPDAVSSVSCSTAEA